MNTLVNQCMLLDEQRNLILQGIKKGKEEYQAIVSLIPHTTTKKYIPYMQTDFVNTGVEQVIKDNPHTKMRVYKKQSGFHPYIVIQDVIRNIFILVCKLPKDKYIYTPSIYRGDFASSNLDRLVEIGVPVQELINDEPYQYSLPLGEEHKPFGIVVSYDAKSDVIFEGALRPSQEDWIYKEDISEYLTLDKENLVGMGSKDLSGVEVLVKAPVSTNDIIIKLKS